MTRNYDSNKRTQVEVAYVTKYALTQGILRVRNAVIVGDTYLSSNSAAMDALWIGKSDWFLSMEDAEARVMLLTKKKIVSLQNHIDALNQTLAAPGRIRVQDYPSRSK